MCLHTRLLQRNNVVRKRLGSTDILVVCQTARTRARKTSRSVCHRHAALHGAATALGLLGLLGGLAGLATTTTGHWRTIGRVVDGLTRLGDFTTPRGIPHRACRANGAAKAVAHATAHTARARATTGARWPEGLDVGDTGRRLRWGLDVGEVTTTATTRHRCCVTTHLFFRGKKYPDASRLIVVIFRTTNRCSVRHVVYRDKCNQI